jgi:hypothetical protein
LAVEGLVLEDGESDECAPVAIDGDLWPRVGAPIELKRFLIDGNRRREGAAEIDRAGD